MPCSPFCWPEQLGRPTLSRTDETEQPYDGALVLWRHGTPGGSRQSSLPAVHRENDADSRGVVVGRPGSGVSDPHAYPSWPTRPPRQPTWPTPSAPTGWALWTFSAGGPFALAWGAVFPLATRVPAVGHRAA